jgi:uncharacterized membrane protein
MNDAESRELVIVLLTMGVLFILALAAVALFIRQWRKEHLTEKNSSQAKARSPKSGTRS